LGRFIQPDSLVQDISDPQSWNRYAYVRNNPLKYTDPSGHVIDYSGGDPSTDDPGDTRDDPVNGEPAVPPTAENTVKRETAPEGQPNTNGGLPGNTTNADSNANLGAVPANEASISTAPMAEGSINTLEKALEKLGHKGPIGTIMELADRTHEINAIIEDPNLSEGEKNILTGLESVACGVTIGAGAVGDVLGIAGVGLLTKNPVAAIAGGVAVATTLGVGVSSAFDSGIDALRDYYYTH
jgi:hypothetical protein